MKTLMILTTIFLISFMTMEVIGSAIPMWELLSKDVKRNRVYQLFLVQVMQYCLNSQKPADCKSNLYKLAIKTLDNIDEVTLDQLDPHQHNAEEIIWLALTGSYRVSPRIGQDIKSTYFPTNEFLMIGNDNMEKNKIGDKLLLKNDYAHISPMETRVYPDGRPVPDNRKKFRPIDDDIDEYTMEKLPSISDIEKNSDKNVHRNKVLNNGRRGSLHRFTRRISIEDDNNDDPDLDDDDDDDDD